MYMGKISLYGSIVLLLGAFFIALFVGVGIKGIFILIAFIAGILGVLYTFFRIVPEIWASIIISISSIAFLQYVIQSWLFSISLIVLLLVYVLFHVLKMTERWKGKVLVTFFIVMIVGIVLHSDYKPEIENQVLDEVSEEMLEDHRVEHVSLETDESEVRCFLVVEDDVLLTERTEIGETCAKRISDKVKMKDKRFNKTKADVGQLYDYYGLAVDVLPVEKGKPLNATKYATEDKVSWHVNRYLSDEESKLINDLQYDDLIGKEFTMTASYDAYNLDFNAKDIHIYFNSAVAIVKKDGETTEFNYYISDKTGIVFEDDHELYYRLDLITKDEVLFLKGGREGKGYIFKVE